MRMSRTTGTVSGLLITLLGLWGGLIAFVGPYFDYSFGVNATWHYTSDRLWLSILPGALAVLAGLLLVGAMTRVGGILAGWLAVAAGAWFVVGPAVSLSWEHGPGPIGAPLFGTTRQMLELVGYFYGLGALIVALGAFSIGRFASRPLLADEETIARVPSTEAPAPAPAPRAQRRSRLPLVRRRGVASGASGRPIERQKAR
jgi:hypothetical protein